MVLENQLTRKSNDIASLKAKLELRLANDQKYTIKNRAQFEKHFGRQARPAEEKYVNYLKMFDE